MLVSEQGATQACDQAGVRRAGEMLRDQRPAAPQGARLSEMVFSSQASPSCCLEAPIASLDSQQTLEL